MSLFMTPGKPPDDPFPGSSADFYEQIQVLKDRVKAGRVELRQQWERMQTENLALKAEIERLEQKIKEQEEYIQKLKRNAKGVTGQ